jgi:hypothetical protein
MAKGLDCSAISGFPIGGRLIDVSRPDLPFEGQRAQRRSKPPQAGAEPSGARLRASMASTHDLTETSTVPA